MTTCVCGADTTNRRICPSCLAPVVYVPRLKTKRKKQELEGTIKARIRAALVAEGCMVMVHNVDNRNLQGTGLGLGVSDLVVIVPPHGRFLGVEVKRPGREPSPNQEKWLDAVRRFGGITGVASNVQEALALLVEARQSSKAHARSDDPQT